MTDKLKHRVANPLDQTARQWIAGMIESFSQSLKDGDDPEVTFSVKLKEMPKTLIQIRLVDIEGHFTREDYPIEIIEESRRGT